MHFCSTLNPRKSHVSGFPSPLLFRLISAYRPNSIRRVFSGCSSSPNFASLYRNCSSERAARPFLSAARLPCGSRAGCARRSGRLVHGPSSDPVWSENRMSIAGPPPPVVTNQQIQADPVSHRAGELSRLPRPSGRSPMTCDGIGSPVESQRADHRCTASNRTTVVHSPGWKRRAVFEVYLDLLARVSQRR